MSSDGLTAFGGIVGKGDGEGGRKASATGRLPDWLRRPLGQPSRLHAVKKVLRKRNLNTVCESARCPNIGECFSKPTATFMILGDSCTRGCAFCAVNSATPCPPDALESVNIAKTAVELGLKHAVITSVTRDDLPDGGATHFALTIRALKSSIPSILVEVLTPDFLGDERSLKTVFDAAPDIFNHNLETVPSLYATVRPEAEYQRSLVVLKSASEAGLTVKSGIMVGLGESSDEVFSLLRDIEAAGVRIVTIGQYLRPARGNLPVKEYVEPEQFKVYEEFGKSIGILEVYSGPFVRSSYNAEELWKNFTG